MMVGLRYGVLFAGLFSVTLCSKMANEVLEWFIVSNDQQR
jgi:hypothetical protein